MRKFILIFKTDLPFSQDNYPSLYRLLERTDNPLAFDRGLIGFKFKGEAEELHQLIAPHLGPLDELVIFEICAGYWHLRDAAKDFDLSRFLRGQ
jgi:hypothetical protein